MYQRIIHLTDLTEPTHSALKTSHDLAKALGAKLLVSFFATSPQVAHGASITDPTSQATRDIAAELTQLQPMDPAVDFELQIVIAEKAATTRTLLGYIDDAPSDLIVLGLHKKAGVAGWFRPSITEEVVRYSRCPVLVVNHADAMSDEAGSSTVDEDLAD